MKFYVFTEQEGTKNNLTLEEAILELKRKSIYNNFVPCKFFGIDKNDGNYNNDILAIDNKKVTVLNNNNIVQKILRRL